MFHSGIGYKSFSSSLHELFSCNVHHAKGTKMKTIYIYYGSESLLSFCNLL